MRWLLAAMLAGGCGGGAGLVYQPGDAAADQTSGSDAAVQATLDGGPGGTSGSGGGGADGEPGAPGDGGTQDEHPAGNGGAAGGAGAGGSGGAGGNAGAGGAAPVTAVQVSARDEGLTEGNVTKPRVTVKNVGTETLAGFEVRYYFTVSENETPVVDVYYSPEAQLSLVHQAGKRWYVRAVYQRQLAPGERTEGGDGLIYGLHFASWAGWNKQDDESHQGLTATMAVTSAIDVFTAGGVRIYGTVAP